jgi:hypothetical protein
MILYAPQIPDNETPEHDHPHPVVYHPPTPTGTHIPHHVHSPSPRAIIETSAAGSPGNRHQKGRFCDDLNALSDAAIERDHLTGDEIHRVARYPQRQAPGQTLDRDRSRRPVLRHDAAGAHEREDVSQPILLRRVLGYSLAVLSAWLAACCSAGCRPEAVNPAAPSRAVYRCGSRYRLARC